MNYSMPLCSLVDSLWLVVNRTNRLYWVDSQLDQIGHIGIEGYNRQTFTNIGQITQPYSLTVYSGESRSLLMTATYSSAPILHMHNIIQIVWCNSGLSSAIVPSFIILNTNALNKCKIWMVPFSHMGVLCIISVSILTGLYVN